MIGEYWINCARCGAEITADHVYEPGEVFTCEGCGKDWTMDSLITAKLEAMDVVVQTPDGFIFFSFGNDITGEQSEH